MICLTIVLPPVMNKPNLSLNRSIFTWTDSGTPKARNRKDTQPTHYETMKALVCKRYGGPDQVTFADVARPVPKPDEILQPS